MYEDIVVHFGFDVLIEVALKSTVFWVAMPRSSETGFFLRLLSSEPVDFASVRIKPETLGAHAESLTPLRKKLPPA
jgi:hypothetical protein